jgi:hypothetical protein
MVTFVAKVLVHRNTETETALNTGTVPVPVYHLSITLLKAPVQTTVELKSIYLGIKRGNKGDGTGIAKINHHHQLIKGGRPSLDQSITLSKAAVEATVELNSIYHDKNQGDKGDSIALKSISINLSKVIVA